MHFRFARYIIYDVGAEFSYNGERDSMNGYKTKVDLVYEMLMEKISHGDYQDGERLVISQISKENKVSDIPVREAIRRLESEGYVSVIANQGAVIRSFSQERITEIFQIKAVLEGYAARLSIDYLTQSDIDDLCSLNDKLRKALQAKEEQEYSKLNMEFHLRMYRDMPYRELYNMIQELWKKYSITKTVFSITPSRMQQSIDEHEQIIDLIVHKEHDELERLMRIHKMKAGYSLIQGMQQKAKSNG